MCVACGYIVRIQIINVAKELKFYPEIQLNHFLYNIHRGHERFVATQKWNWLRCLSS